MDRQGWAIARNDSFYEHESGSVRVNRSYDSLASRPFQFSRKSDNDFWIVQTRRSFATAEAAMKAAEAFA